MPEPLIRSISDTARWVAYHRATESDRSDAIFRDPYARRLAGERGELIGAKLKDNAWAIAVRTYLFDGMIQSLLKREPVEMVVNLAAGLDSRPYRLELPPSLVWVEVDLPEILDPKRQTLASDKPRCQLEVITQHLGEVEPRRALFERLNQRGKRTLVLSEGLLTYLDDEKVTSLAAALHAQPTFAYWLIEVVSPKVLQFVNRRLGRYLQAANAPMQFAPTDWRSYYKERGWEAVEFQSISETAFKVHREPGMMKLFRKIGDVFPGWREKQRAAWESGVALLRRI